MFAHRVDGGAGLVALSAIKPRLMWWQRKSPRPTITYQ
jgi:hypothetical protein